MRLDLRDLGYFAAIAEHGNLGRASESLGLSQPALSKSLRRLERAAQTKLVRKTPKGVELTSVGSAFLAHCRRIRLSLDDVAREVAGLAAGGVGHVRVGANYHVSEHVLPAVCAGFTAETPARTLEVTVGANDVLLPALRAGKFDLIVSTMPANAGDDLAQVRLFDVEFVVCAARAHRLASRERVPVAEVAKERWALSREVLPSQWLFRAFEERGLGEPRVALQTTSLPLRLQAVSASSMLGFVPRAVIRQSRPPLLVELPVRELVWRCPVGVRYRKDAYLAPAAQRFIEKLQAATADGKSPVPPARAPGHRRAGDYRRI